LFQREVGAVRMLAIYITSFLQKETLSIALKVQSLKSAEEYLAIYRRKTLRQRYYKDTKKSHTQVAKLEMYQSCS